MPWNVPLLLGSFSSVPPGGSAPGKVVHGGQSEALKVNDSHPPPLPRLVQPQCSPIFSECTFLTASAQLLLLNPALWQRKSNSSMDPELCLLFFCFELLFPHS